MDNQQKQQVVEQVKKANNVLVAVSSNPTVDELAASIGLTLALNKLDKHATTVFSGHVPSTIEFLQPEKTIETTTDSLRDFIIALDKSKADKLRYKVEDDVVRIFITPYHTTISEHDLEFSHGDFNVDVVIGLGVTRQEDLDKAITAHGRILHDAAMVSLTKRDQHSELGSVQWHEQQASSLCEMVAALTYDLGREVIDGQMATAFLTGIIAETDRFRNEKTSPAALSLSSQLMSAGANQQLIAEKLEEPAHDVPMSVHTEEESPAGNDGELEIQHDTPSGESEEEIDRIHIDEHGNLRPQDEILPLPEDIESSASPSNYLNPPNFSGEPRDDREEQPTLQQASTDTPIMAHGRTISPPADPLQPPKTDKPFDLQEALSQSNSQPMQPTEQQARQAADYIAPTMPPAPNAEANQAQVEPNPVEEPSRIPPINDTQSLADIEQTVDSPHLQQQEDSLQAAQEAVAQAANAQPPQYPTPQASIGAQHVDLNPAEIVDPTNSAPTSPRPAPASDQDPNAPPPVPPPMTAQFYDENGNNNNPFLNPGQH